MNWECCYVNPWTSDTPQDRGSVSEVEACVEHVSTRLLSPSHHFAMKLKSHLVMLYDARWGQLT